MKKIIKIYLVFKRAINDVKLLLYYKKRLSGIRHFLEPGVYIISCSKRTIFKKENDVVDYLTSTFKFTYETLFAKDKLLGSFFLILNRTIVKNENSAFFGHFVVFSNKLKEEKQYGDLKIFDIKRKRILTSFNTAESYHKRQSAAAHFNRFFLIPTLLCHNDIRLLTIEEMVDFIPPPNLLQKDYLTIAKNILNFYTAYFRKIYQPNTCEKVKPASFFEYQELHPKNKANIEFIRSVIDESVLNTEIPVVYQHGDLSISNILLTKNKNCYIIDWEHTAHFSFLYDIMFFWQNEAKHQNNHTPLVHYFQGGYDIQMRNIFRALDMEYDIQHRLTFYLIAVSEVIKNRVLKRSPMVHNAHLNDRVMPMVKKAINLHNML